MKKLVLMLTAAITLCSSVVMAQKIDTESITSKLEKADAESQHAKKGLKASTWLSRGDLYFNTIVEPTKALFVGAEKQMIELACGKGKPAKKKIDGTEYSTLTYPYFVVYLQNNKVAAWQVSKLVNKDALKIALESYAKAMELDPQIKDKVIASMDVMINYYTQLGAVSNVIKNMKAGSDAYLNICKIQETPTYNKLDPMIPFYAGYMLTILGETTPAAFPRAEASLNKAVKAGYLAIEDADTTVTESERGNIYYYLYYCAYSQREKNKNKITAAKKYLQTGIEKYPKNESIFEGLLQIYTVEEGMGDPKELLGTIEKTIKVNPKSASAWFARGRIYNAMKDYDECITSFKHVVEIEPEAFDGNYYLGLFYMLKGDEVVEEMKAITYTDQSKYDADLAKLNAIYIQAIPYFETAHKAKPKDEATLEYLKQLCFRLREEPGVMEKYTKYNELFKTL